MQLLPLVHKTTQENMLLCHSVPIATTVFSSRFSHPLKVIGKPWCLSFQLSPSRYCFPPSRGAAFAIHHGYRVAARPLKLPARSRQPECTTLLPPYIRRSNANPQAKIRGPHPSPSPLWFLCSVQSPRPVTTHHLRAHSASTIHRPSWHVHALHLSALSQLARGLPGTTRRCRPQTP